MGNLRIPVGAALVTWHLGGPGQDGEVLTTMGVDNEDPWTQTDVEELYGAFLAEILPVLATPLLFHKCSARVQIDATDQLILEHSDENNGSDGADMMPLNVSLLVKKVTGFAGQRNQGRMFIPGIREARVNDAGQVTGAYFTALQEACDDFLALVGAGVRTPMLFHHSSATPREITSLQASPFVATQRGRLSRV